jgi:hypothetical protein
LYTPTSITNIFGNWLHGIVVLITSIWFFLGWEEWLWYGHSDYVEMTKFLIIKIVLSCRWSIGALELSVYGRNFIV